MKPPTDESGFFPTIATEFADQAKADALRERLERVAHHIESMLNCWEEWDGNKAIVVGTRIEIGSTFSKLAVDAPNYDIGLQPKFAGTGVYAYMAPCFITEVRNAETFVAQIDYPPEVTHCRHLNGTKLLLDILDVWPPVRLLSLARREEDAEDAKDAELAIPVMSQGVE
jgi:hypothetical protein